MALLSSPGAWTCRGSRAYPIRILLASVLLATTSVEAQPGTNYGFTSSAGTYAPITGGTVLISGTNWNNQRYTVALPSPFWFDGAWYTTMFVTANGFITFGSMMANTNFLPLSNGAGYAGAISPFGTNLQDANTLTSAIRWQQVGDEVVVQWQEAQRKFGGNGESFSFQARMNTANGVIRFVYSGVTNLSNNTTRQPQVGLRGSSNVFPVDVKNRQVVAGGSTWITSANGASNAAICRFTNAAPSASTTNGLTYTFIPPCVLASASVIGTIGCTGEQATVSVTGTSGAAPYSGTGNFQRPSGTHQFTVTDALGCSNTADIIIDEPSALSVSATVSTPIACHGGLAYVNVAGIGGTAPFTGTGTMLRTTGTHTFNIADANGCMASIGLAIPQPDILFASASTVSLETYCAAGDAVVNVAATGGTPAYSGTGINIGITAGSQVFVVTDANNCMTTAVLSLPEPDGDNDGTGDCGDECPDDPLKIVTGQCGCGVQETDTDADGAADCTDNCPNDPAKVDPGACGCGTPETDTDRDTWADCVDGCPADAMKMAPGLCGCGQADSDSDEDGVLDCFDTCPNGPEVGSPCDDGDPDSSNDSVGLDCTCSGTSTTGTVTFTLTTDNNGSQTSWEILPLGGGAALCAGAGQASNTTASYPCDLPDGEFVLRVMDSAGDGLCCGTGNSGFTLFTTYGDRIIDASVDASYTTLSCVVPGFSLPLGTDGLTASRCDRTDLLPDDFIQADPSEAVRDQYGDNNTNTGYQFWIFDPNGGYSRRILVTHASAHWVFPAGPDRCSYLRLSQVVTDPIPHNKALNVRVRSKVNGSYEPFGPACRLRIDLPGSCPTTQLMDDVDHPYHSCGLSNVVLDGSQWLYAVPVSQATSYEFEFTSGNYLRRVITTGCGLLLSEWMQLPLEYGMKHYEVRVRASYDNGVNWCPYGATCGITTAPGAPVQERTTTVVGSDPANLRIWPNPAHEGDLNVLLNGLTEMERSARLTMIDLQGRIIADREVTAQNGQLSVQLTADENLPTGTYLITIRTEGRTWTDRVVME